MATGLSLMEQVEEHVNSGVKSQLGTHWEGRLEEWLAVVTSPIPDPDDPNVKLFPKSIPSHSAAGIQDWSFPTDDLRDAYLEHIESRSKQEIYHLLRLFLFHNSRFGSDDDILDLAISSGLKSLQHYPKEYSHRLLASIGNSDAGQHIYPHPGVRWALDLLPDHPDRAISVISAYLSAYAQVLPDGRYVGLCDAMSIIRARWINPSTQASSYLFELSPRNLERILAALYRKLGYQVSLTSPSRDGGRDVIAVNTAPGRHDYVLVECKAHTSPIRVDVARKLLGVVSHEHANRGVLVTTSRFTRGARKLSEADPRLELIDGSTLTHLLSSAFGNSWHTQIEIICHDIED